MDRRPDELAPPDGPHDTALIRVGEPIVTFVQVWRVKGPEAQSRWLEIMHASVHILRAKPGFVTMNLHASFDGSRIAVYAQWTSRETLEAAITDPEAVAAHDRMTQIGSSDGALYAVDRVYTALS